MDGQDDITSKRQGFIDSLIGQLKDPIHKRLVEVYAGSEPITGVQAELDEILVEVLRHED
ncbi:MAG: hypothetical protein HPY55_03905 [Firmicutes bacterium]|nr:hypothetical protein [Bacillota bacterium]